MIMETFDELRELMEEPPGGYNHGRQRGAGGAWESVEQADYVMQTQKRYAESRKHGTEYTYRKLGCRCPTCRAYKSLQNAAYRLGLATSTDTAPDTKLVSKYHERAWPDDFRGFGSNVRPPRSP
jgi:hypothetical protein